MSWNQLLALLKEKTEVEGQYRHRRPICCPNDAHALTTGLDGRLFCPWDGWHEDRGGSDDGQ